MPKQTFTLNDFSGGANGYVDPLDIADNELAICQGFKPEPGTVIVLGDMKGAYTPSAANGSDTITIEPGYGIFAFAHDYDKDGHLNATQYLVLMDNVTFDVYDDDGDAWQAYQFHLGAVASDASFSGSVKPCFFIAEGALRVSPGNFTANDNGGQTNGALSAELVHGGYVDVTVDATASNHVSIGDTIVIAGQEMVVLYNEDSTSMHVARNMTGAFTSTAIDNSIIYSVLETRWRGVVKRRNFADVTTIGTFTDWYSSFAHPRPPVEHNANIDHDTVVPDYAYPFLVNYSVGDITIDGEQAPVLHVGYYASTANPDATWDGASIQLYTTALYDDVKQESQPNKYGTAITVAAAKEFAVWIGVEYSDDGSAYRIHKRVTGARLYYEDETNDPGILYQLLEIDFEKGAKKAEAETFDVWTNTIDASGGIASGNEDECCECPWGGTNSGADASDRTSGNAFIFTDPPKAFSYEHNTGYPPDVNTHARYKTAVVAGNRLFAGNIYQSGRAHGDLMIGSPPGKYDILPRMEPYARRVSAGDGDEIVKLETYADRILQFKKRALYIVNIGGGLGEEFVESEHKNMGVENPSQTCMTEYGVAWVNSHGVFLYDGQEITDLTLNKLQMTNTIAADRPRALNIIESNIPTIGYHPDNKWLIVNVASDVSTAFEAEAWIHDFKNGSWTYSQEFSADADYKTNMIWTSDNNLVFAAGTNSSDTPDFFKYRTPSANMSQDKLLFLTKDFHLDAPGVKKKLRSIYVTYSASADSYIEADLVYKSISGEATDDLEEADSGNTYYTEALGFKSTSGAVRTVELVPTTYSTNAYTFQLKLHNDDAAYPYGADFKLYNVSFVYRPLGAR